MKIIITGSLGNISNPLAQQVIAQGHEVTVISSKADKRHEIETLGAKAAIGSVMDVAFLKQVFAGADTVYGISQQRNQFRTAYRFSRSEYQYSGFIEI